MNGPRVLTLSRTPDPRVAVMLNANARAVTPRVVRAISEVVPRRDLFVSTSVEDARDIVGEISSRSYDTVLTGGGDGTLMGFINAYLAHNQNVVRGNLALADVPLPRLGALRLGTGNAVATMCGASPMRGAGVLEDILHARAGRLARTRRLDLVEVDGVRAPFAGIGYDALILNNYNRWKKILGVGPLRTLGEGLLGYSLSIGALSIPQVVTRQHRDPEVEVINVGADAWRLDRDGRRVGAPIRAGEVLYRGRSKIVAAGTCPYYGFSLKIFPFADRLPGRMQLRLANAPLADILANIPALFRGEYFHPDVHDFEVERAEVRTSAPSPFQVGGDGAGWRDRVVFSVSDHPVEMLEFARSLPAARRRLPA